MKSHLFQYLFYVLAFVKVCFFTDKAFAQTTANPIGIATGGANTGLVRDVDAFGVNPAFFLSPSTSTTAQYSLSFSLGAIGVYAGESAFSLNDIQQYFGKVGNERRTLSDEELRTASLLLDGSRISARTDILPLTAVLQTPIGAFAAAVSVHGHTGFAIPTGLSQVFQGYNAGVPLSIRFDQSSALLHNSIHAGYARHLELSQPDDSNSTLAFVRFGGSLQYCAGNAFEQIQSANVDITPLPVTGFPTITNNLHLRYAATTRSAGTSLLTRNTIPKEPLQLLNTRNGEGVGVSLGGVLAMRLPGSSAPAWQFSFALNDFGGLWWNNAARADLTGNDTIRTILTFADSTYLQRFREPQHRSEAHFTPLPAILNFGFAFDYGAYFHLRSPIIVSIQYTQGLNNFGSNTTQPRISLGFAFENQGFIPSLRTGLSLGGQEQILWSCGLGWNIAQHFSFDAALTNLLPFLNSGNGTWLGASVRMKGRIDW
jgi:hypothetical protein